MDENVQVQETAENMLNKHKLQKIITHNGDLISGNFFKEKSTNKLVAGSH